MQGVLENIELTEYEKRMKLEISAPDLAGKECAKLLFSGLGAAYNPRPDTIIPMLT